MIQKTVIFGFVGIFLFVGMGMDFGGSITEREMKLLEEENQIILDELIAIESKVAWIQREHIKNPYKGLARIVTTAYNSEVGQTDDTPFVTASGNRVDDETLALSRDMIRAQSNFMERMGYSPAATITYGDTVDLIYVRRMIVKDTMNRRYQNRADIWMNSKKDALEWGKREVLIVPLGANN